MNEAALESKEELENFKKDAAEPGLDPLKLNIQKNFFKETSKSSKNAIDSLEEEEINNHQNYEEDDDDDFGDFEEAPQTAFNRVNIPEKEDELDCQNAFKDENCSTSQQQAPTTTSTTKPTYLTIKDIIEQPELIETLKIIPQTPKVGNNNLILIKSTTSSNSIFDDLFKQMDNIEQINLEEEGEIEEGKVEEEDEEAKEDEEKKLRRHSSIVYRSLNFWSQICFIEEAKALKFKFADSFTFKRMVETLRFNNNSSCDEV
ncbi:unnamed protein product [Meloidogyne enterolobii]|uniref:Uncharacterized protein n=1 Tax=Meloidogyne enterolobii TaxID=390850 RepID=A0ACB0XZD3_MELEN